MIPEKIGGARPKTGCSPLLIQSVWTLLIGFFLVGAWSSSPASARTLSSAESEALQEVLESSGRSIDDTPEGKVIGTIWVAPLPVFGKKEPSLIRWSNNLRIHTREEVVRAELLIEEGDLFDAQVVEENELHLIGAGFASIVVIVPLQSEQEDTVDVLVVTRDLWSLRLSTDFETAGSVVNYALLSLTDTNLLGYNKTIQASFLLRQRNVDIGARYFDRNLLGKRFVLDWSQGIVISREDEGGLEGHYGALRFGRPLVSRREKWGYDLSVSYREDVYRNLIGSEIAPFEVDGIEEEAFIPWRYPRFSSQAKVLGLRGMGYAYRHIFRWGLTTSYFAPEVPDDLPTNSVTAAIFRQSLESWKQQIQTFLIGHRFFEWRYMRLYNYNTYDLGEYVGLGPSTDMEVNWSSGALLGSDRDYIRFAASAWWTWRFLQDGFIRPSLFFSTRLEETFQAKSWGTGLRWLFPSMGGWGRFVTNGTVNIVVDPISTGNPLFSRGGESGLRGLVFQSLQGNNILQTNLEYRSPSLRVFRTRLGFAAFHDMGATFQLGDLPEPQHSVGVGLRLLFLSTNRDVIRVDYGIPVGGLRSGFQYGLVTAGFGQAF